MSEEVSEAQLEEAINRAKQRVEPDDTLARPGAEPPSPQSEPEETRCEECGDTKPMMKVAGVVALLPCRCEIERQRQEDYEEWSREMTGRHIESLKARSSLPARLERFTFETFEASASPDAAKALKEMKHYVKAFPCLALEGSGRILFGGVGTGKTHLAVAAMQEIISIHRVPALFTTVPYLLDELRSAYSDGLNEPTLALPTAAKAELLILDDLGTEKSSEWVSEKLFQLINHRYVAQLPTIITTNVGPQEIGARIGERIVSRLVESCEWIPLEGEDQRFARARTSKKHT